MRKNLLGKIAVISGNILMVGFFVLGVIIFCNAKGGTVGVIFAVFIATACAIVAGLLAYLLYGELVAGKFVNSLLWSNGHFKKIEKSMSIPRGYIKRRQFDLAVEYLSEIIERKPTYFDANFLLFQLYLDELKNYEMAYDVAAKYFANSQGQYDTERLTFVVRFSTLLNSSKLADENLILLQNEIKNKKYRKSEVDILKLRANKTK